MKNYSAEIEVPIAFMKDCMKNEDYNNKTKPLKPKNSFNNFEQRRIEDFAALESKLLEN